MIRPSVRTIPLANDGCAVRALDLALKDGLTAILVKVYCWGDIKARDKREGYLLELASLDNLVIKAIPTKPKNTEE